jgi:hypothetical protein
MSASGTVREIHGGIGVWPHMIDPLMPVGENEVTEHLTGPVRQADPPSKAATMYYEDHRPHARQARREVATFTFAANGKAVSFVLNDTNLSFICLQGLQDHRNAGWPDARLDREQMLGKMVRDLGAQIQDAALAQVYADNPVQLPWGGDGLLTLVLE